MAKHNKPRRGSLAFRPRKRSSTDMPRVNAWPLSDKAVLLGFAGYKAGMTHVIHTDQSKSHLKGREISDSVTIVEVPDMIVYGVRCMRFGETVKDILTDNKDVLNEIRYVKLAKKPVAMEYPENYDEVFVLAYTKPSETTMGKKTVEKMMIKVGGSHEDALNYAKGLVSKPIKINDVFTEGQYVDVISVTKGKGWQGVIKRFGVATQRPKASKHVRHVGNLGPFKPGYVGYEAPQAGQMGYHKRTEYNKLLMKIGDKPEEVNPRGGIPKYGEVRTNYVLIKGSVPGPKKRLIRLRLAIRRPDKTQAVQVNSVSTEPQN